MAITFTERKRRQKAAWRKNNPDKVRRQNYNGKPQRIRPFVGVDGEGHNRKSDGRHLYNMLRVGGDLLEPSNGECLSSWECLDFLSSLDPNPIYVAYYFDYDVTKILEDVSWYKLRRLIDRESRQGKHGNTFPVDLQDGRYRIDYLPGKFFKCCRRRDDGTYSKWITVNDVGSFFQCKFCTNDPQEPGALDQWEIGTPEQRAAIAAGKDLRNSFRLTDVAEIAKYNSLEIVLLEDLMEQFREACIAVGYVPRRWQGPGQIAEVMLDMNGVPRSKDVPILNDPKHARLLEFGRNAFYGGRPETTGVGQFGGGLSEGPTKQPVYQWDYNSAYPYALTHAPCLVHGTWDKQIGTDLPIEPLSLCYGSFEKRNEPGRPVLYGLPFRTESGVIMYPERGRGWYWGFEIIASVHQVFHAEETWTYEKHCSCKPFDFIPELYARRKAMGKDGRGKVLKLALNSLYGKMAQSIGSPKFANPIWASFITAFCRTQIQELIHSAHGRERFCGQGVAMIATDAIFTCHDLEVEASEELGALSKVVHDDGIFVIQPGLYFKGNGEGPKTRGVPKSKVVEYRDQFLENYNRMRDTRDLADGDVCISLRCFVGIRQALHRNNRTLLGQWVATTKTISFDWSNKRLLHFTNSGPFVKHIGTFPYIDPPQEETTPYSKDIGALFAELKLDQMDQPDWSDIALFEGEKV